MKRGLSLGVLSLGFCSFEWWPGMAQANEYSNTIGGTIASAQTTLPWFNYFISAVALLGGICITIMGLMSLAKSQEGSGDPRATLTKAFFKIFGGAALAAFPDVMHIGVFTLLNGSSTYLGGLDTSPGVVQTCLTDAVNASSLSCVAKNIGVNVAPVVVKFLFAGSFVGGSYVIFKALFILAAQSEHNRIPPVQLWQRIGVGLIACNVPMAMYIMQTTLGIHDGVITTTGSLIGGDTPTSLLTYRPDTSVAILKQFAETISWIFVFLSAVGVGAFVWGLMILYSLSSGQGGHKTVLSAWVRMIAGVSLANVKTAGCILVTTAVNQALGLCG